MTPSSTIMEDPSHQTLQKSGCEAGCCCCLMESLGSAVLNLGQQQVVPPPFLEEEEDVFPWQGEGRRRRNSLLGSSSHEEPKEAIDGGGGGRSFALEPNNKEEGGGGGEALLELRRRQGRSFSLPSSPSLAFQDGGAKEEDFLEDHAQQPSCCTKCKKRVQFADSLGLCLASVKHFSSAEEPQVPPAVLSRLQSFPMRRKDLEDFIMAAGLSAGSCSSFSNSNSVSSADVAMAPPVATSGMTTTMAPPQTPLRLEPRRRPQGPQEEQEEAMVSLEEVSGIAVSGAPSDVRGVVRVQKCPGPKEVTVRYTFNEWLSFLDASAALDDDDSHSDNDIDKAPFDSSSPSTEKYRFALSLPPGLDRGTAVHFAICYRSHRGEFWDNNGGANYTLFP